MMTGGFIHKVESFSDVGFVTFGTVESQLFNVSVSVSQFTNFTVYLLVLNLDSHKI